jgi:lipoprotein-anchoring transpeptidase ErfK/SrfK
VAFESAPEPLVADTPQLDALLDEAPELDDSDALSADSKSPPVEVGDPERLSAEHVLAALAQETAIYQRPDRASRKLGALRTGALVGRAVAPAGRRGCSGGWYHVAPEGYVCVGRAATLDADHPVVQLASQRPDRSAPLPYAYGRTRPPVRPVLYNRLPTPAEQRLVEKDLVGLRSQRPDAGWEEQATTAGPPALLAGGERVPRPYGIDASELLSSGMAVMNSAFAFVDLFEAEGRKWGLTTELALVSLDRVAPVKASDFHGVPLDGASSLPLAFVRSTSAYLFSGDPATGTQRAVRPIAYREAFSLSGRSVVAGGVTYVETSDGNFLVDKSLVRIEPPRELPTWAKNRQSWVDVSILKQTLVAYEGERPVYATLVSTGKDGLGDPKTTHSTVQGTFRIHTKHVTATMSGDEADDPFELHDVPYVQYFHEGFALHAAYWHEGFGGPRSHGCINLSPEDARWLFSWTDPPVPQAWHSALSREGTIVHVHP